jgi:hypothetical protein
MSIFFTQYYQSMPARFGMAYLKTFCMIGIAKRGKNPSIRVKYKNRYSAPDSAIERQLLGKDV